MPSPLLALAVQPAMVHSLAARIPLVLSLAVQSEIVHPLPAISPVVALLITVHSLRVEPSPALIPSEFRSAVHPLMVQPSPVEIPAKPSVVNPLLQAEQSEIVLP